MTSIRLKSVFLGLGAFIVAANCAVADVRVLLIAVNSQKDRRVPSLGWTKNDMKDVEGALKQVGIADAFDNVRVTKLIDDEFRGLQAPTKAAIDTAIDDLVKDVTPKDTVIFYYTGHAHESSKQGAVFLPADATVRGKDVANVISMKDVGARLAQSRAATKFMFVDTCHSGAIADLPVRPVSKSIALSHRGLYVITSSADDEVSLLWPSREMSLATRWFCHGLRGAADADRDGCVSFDELSEFVATNVSESFAAVKDELGADSRQLLRRIGQTGLHPRRMITEPWGNPKVFMLQPRKTDPAFRQLASLLADRIRAVTHTTHPKKRVRVGVLPFLSLTGGKLRRGVHPVLEQIGAPRLTTELFKLTKQQFSIIKPESLAAALEKLKVSDIDTQDQNAFRQLQAKLSEQVDVLVNVRADVRDDLMIMTAELLTNDGAVLTLGRTTVVALSPEIREFLRRESGEYYPAPAIVAMARRSNVVTPNAVPQPPQSRPDDAFPSTDTDPSQTETPANDTEENREGRLTPQNEQFQVETHPQWDNYVGWPVRIRLEAKQADGAWRKVPFVRKRDPKMATFHVEKSEFLRLVVRNQTDRHLAFVLLVDGINTLGKAPQQPRDALQSSNYFILEPGATNSIAGWYVRKTPVESSDAGARFTHEPFLVVDAPKSVAGQQDYTNNLGEIRAYVYGTVPANEGRRSVGIGAGRAVDRSLPVVRRVGDLTQKAHHIYYRYVAK